VRRTTLAILIALAPGAGALADAEARRLVAEGNELFRQGQTERAAELYQRAIEADPETLEAVYNRAVAAYEQGRLEEAERLLQRVDSARGAGDLAARARYNLGRLTVDRLMSDPPRDPEQAIERLKFGEQMFRGSLDLDPNDREAARNLELTRMMRAEIERQLAELERQREQLEQLAEDLARAEQDQRRESRETRSLDEQQAPEAQGDQSGGRSDQQRSEQEADQRELSERTGELSERLEELRRQMQEQALGDQLLEAQEAVERARQAQERAAQQLEQARVRRAERSQERAADDLRSAFEILQEELEQGEESEGEQQQGEQPEQEGNQEQEAQQQDQAPQERRASDAPGPGDEELEADQIAELVEQLLEKERREREQLREHRRRREMQARPVEKDW